MKDTKVLSELSANGTTFRMEFVQKHNFSRNGAAEMTFLPPPRNTEGYSSINVVNPDGADAALEYGLYYVPPPCEQPNWYGSGETCRPCDEGATCPGGSRYWPRPTYWVETEFHPYVYACKLGFKCLGGQFSECADGYEGFMCNDCAAGFYRRAQQCAECSGSKVVPIVVMALVWLGFAVGSLVLTVQRLGGMVWTGLMLQTFRAAGLMCISNNWRPPQSFDTFIEVLGVFSLDFELAMPGCSGSFDGSVLGTIDNNGWLILSVTGSWLLLCVVHLLISRLLPASVSSAVEGHAAEVEVGSVRRYIIVGGVLLTLLVYPISAVSARAVLCEEIEIYDVTDWQTKPSSRLRNSNELCGTSSHDHSLALAWTSIALFTVVFPLLSLVQHWKKLQTSWAAGLYKPDRACFSFLTLLFRSVALAWLHISANAEPVTKLVAASSLATVYSAALLVLRPYHDNMWLVADVATAVLTAAVLVLPAALSPAEFAISERGSVAITAVVAVPMLGLLVGVLLLWVLPSRCALRGMVAKSDGKGDETAVCCPNLKKQGSDDTVEAQHVVSVVTPDVGLDNVSEMETPQRHKDESSETSRRHKAATSVQSLFRGHRTRRGLKATPAIHHRAKPSVDDRAPDLSSSAAGEAAAMAPEELMSSVIGLSRTVPCDICYELIALADVDEHARTCKGKTSALRPVDDSDGGVPKVHSLAPSSPEELQESIMGLSRTVPCDDCHELVNVAELDTHRAHCRAGKYVCPLCGRHVAQWRREWHEQHDCRRDDTRAVARDCCLSLMDSAVGSVSLTTAATIKVSATSGVLGIDRLRVGVSDECDEVVGLYRGAQDSDVQGGRSDASGMIDIDKERAVSVVVTQLSATELSVELRFVELGWFWIAVSLDGTAVGEADAEPLKVYVGADAACPIHSCVFRTRNRRESMVTFQNLASSATAGELEALLLETGDVLYRGAKTLHMRAVSGEICAIAVQARDVHGNVSTRGFEPFEGQISMIQDGTEQSAGRATLDRDGTLVEDATVAHVHYQGGGMYGVWAKLMKVGRYRISISLHGTEIASSPVIVDVEAPQLAPAFHGTSRLLGIESECVHAARSSSLVVRLQARDKRGYMCAGRVEGASVQVQGTRHSEQATTSQEQTLTVVGPEEWKAGPHGAVPLMRVRTHGICEVMLLTPAEAGEYVVHLRIHGKDVLASPFKLVVGLDQTDTLPGIIQGTLPGIIAPTRGSTDEHCTTPPRGSSAAFLWA